jgi:tetratricopeptide (TPR) repeat protein
MILPVKLSADYSYNQIPLVSDPLSWRAVIPFIALLLLVLGAGRALRKSPFLFFCGYVFFATFVLVSNWLRPIGTLMSERLMYLPSVGFTCALAYLLVRGLERPRSKVPAGLLSVLILAVYAVRTLERNQDWRDHYRLFKSAVEVSPESSLVQANYAAILLGERNDPHGASKHAQKAIAIYPADPSAHFTLAEACRVTGDLERAVRAYSEVVALAPRTSGGTSALRSLARVHEQLGNIGAAIGDYETLIEWRPSELDAYLGAARLHASMGRHSRAREILVRARAVAPGHPEIENLWTLLKPE